MSNNPLMDKAKAKFMEMMDRVPFDILPDFDASEEYLKNNFPQEYAEWDKMMTAAASYEHKLTHHRDVN